MFKSKKTKRDRYNENCYKMEIALLKERIEKYKAVTQEKDMQIQELKDAALLKCTTTLFKDGGYAIPSVKNVQKTVEQAIADEKEKTDAQYRLMRLLERNYLKTEKYQQLFRDHAYRIDDPLRSIKYYDQCYEQEKHYQMGYNDGVISGAEIKVDMEESRKNAWIHSGIAYIMFKNSNYDVTHNYIEGYEKNNGTLIIRTRIEIPHININEVMGVIICNRCTNMADTTTKEKFEKENCKLLSVNEFTDSDNVVSYEYKFEIRAK